MLKEKGSAWLYSHLCRDPKLINVFSDPDHSAVHKFVFYVLLTNILMLLHLSD